MSQNPDPMDVLPWSHVDQSKVSHVYTLDADVVNGVITAIITHYNHKDLAKTLAQYTPTTNIESIPLKNGKIKIIEAYEIFDDPEHNVFDTLEGDYVKNVF